MTAVTKVEYRVKEIKRYVVTRYCEKSSPNGDEGDVSERGEYASADMAYEVGYALCKKEHEDLGYPPADERIQYPEHPLGSAMSETLRDPRVTR